MKRGNGDFGLLAVVVESIGAMVLLFLLFPMEARPTIPEQVSSGAASSKVLSSEAVTSDTTVPLISWTESIAQASAYRLPILSLPAPPVEAPSTMATVSEPVDTKAAQERREFVARELEYSRRALVMMLDQYVQWLVEPFRGNE